MLMTQHTCGVSVQTWRALTTDGDNITLKDAHWMSQNEVAKNLIAHTNSAGKNCLSEISNGKIDQDPVQRMTQFLELGSGHQHQTVGKDR